MRGLFLRHTQHNAHTMQRENKRHRSHISDGWWTPFSPCQCRKLLQCLMCTWENEYLFVLLTRCFPPTTSQQINKYIHTRSHNKLALISGVKRGTKEMDTAVWEDLVREGQGFLGRPPWLWRALYVWERKASRERLWCSRFGQNSPHEEESEGCSVPSDE